MSQISHTEFMISYRVKRGFTLIELLVVFAIMGVLTVIGIGNFQNTRIKARDVTRKSDLSAISKSLELYINDYGTYPTASNGEIVCVAPNTVCEWGEPFTDSHGTIYAASLPIDPVTEYTYYYASNGTTYTLYATLENQDDKDIDTTITTTCGSATCNYQLKSSNQL